MTQNFGALVIDVANFDISKNMENQINRQKVIISFLVLLLFLVNEVIMSCDPKDKSRPSCQCKTEKGFTVDLEKVFDDVKKEASVPL